MPKSPPPSARSPPPPPSALRPPPPPSALRPATLYVITTLTLIARTAHHLHSSAIVPMGALGSGYQIFKKFLKVSNTGPNPLRPPRRSHRRQRFVHTDRPQRFAQPHSSSSPPLPSLHCPKLATLPPLTSSSSIFAQIPSPPTTLSALPTLRCHHLSCLHRSPPSLLYHYPHLAALAAFSSGFQVFQKYLPSPRSPPSPPPTLYVVTTIPLIAPCTQHLYSYLYPHLATLASGFQLFKKYLKISNKYPNPFHPYRLKKYLKASNIYPTLFHPPRPPHPSKPSCLPLSPSSRP